ncbi:prephenate dehydrogenase/arogenate dehydrogenase family protein [Oleidesulfovibrio sp.]|uniref:prephenate dehydrogenase/arogenate dehydrogenase family protein n=1 Tax=Oleidesulfovibrio sp. TaxID=2909707 RepID=UPI003A86B5FA
MRIKKAAIVGAGGRMGQLFCARARAAGVQIVELDQPLTHGMLEQGIAGADMVLLCIPAAALDKVVEGMSGILSGNQILADITSVKVLPMQQMRKHYSGPVVGTHPLFGPSPAQGDSRVAVVPAGGDHADMEACAAVEEFFIRMGFDPFRTTADEHDSAAARIQNLNFITSVAYFATLAHDEAITPFLTPSFRRRLDAARKMLTEDAELFEGLFEANPYSQDAVRAFRAILNHAAAGDVDLLVDRAGWWWRTSDHRGGAPS